MRSLVVFIFMLSAFAAQATNRHYHPNYKMVKQTVSKSIINQPGYCEVEIQNASNWPVHVEGRYLDGDSLQPFDIYPHSYSQHIVLDYYGCMPGINLSITGFDGYVYYNGYVAVNSTIQIPNRLMGKSIKAIVKPAK